MRPGRMDSARLEQEGARILSPLRCSAAGRVDSLADEGLARLRSICSGSIPVFWSNPYEQGPIGDIEVKGGTQPVCLGVFHRQTTLSGAMVESSRYYSSERQGFEPGIQVLARTTA